MWRAGVVVLLAALAALGWWMLPRDKNVPRAPRSRESRETELEARADRAPAPADDGRRGPAEEEAPATTTVTGTVVDERGDPVAGATVCWTTDPTGEPLSQATTDRDGVFRIELPEDGSGCYVVSASGFATLTPYVPRAPFRFELKRGERHVRGRVVDPEGRPVAGARGWIRRRCGLATATSDREGYLDFGNMADYAHAPRAGELLVRADGFVPYVEREDIDDAVDLGDIVLSRGCTIRGIVRVKDSGQPVAGVRVGYAGRVEPVWSATSASDGSYELRTAPAEVEILLAVGRGYLPDRTGWNRNWLGPPLVPAGETELVHDLLVVRAVPVHGRVTDEDGVPVQGALVMVNEQSHERTPRNYLPDMPSGASTDKGGRFAVEGFYPGCMVDVRAEHDAQGTARVEGRAGEAFEIRLTRDCRVFGRVLDAAGEPASDAAVYLTRTDDSNDPGYSHYSDDGRFVFAHVRPGKWDLDADADDCAPLTMEIIVRPGQRELRVPDLVLREGGVIEGVVLDPDGVPLPEAEILVETDEECAGSGRDHNDVLADDDGRFRIAGLGNATFRVRVFAKGLYNDDLEAAVGGPELRIRMKRTITLRGRVSAGGRPLPGVGVAVNGSYGVADTGRDGTFALDDMRPDRSLSLEFWHPLCKTLRLERVAPWDGVREFALVQGRMFQGIVVNEDGKPLAGLRVNVCTKDRKDIRGVETDAAGRFRVGGLEEGPTVVNASGVGYAVEPPLEVPEGVSSCRLVLRKGYEMTMLVRRKNGKPPDDVSLTVFRADGTEVEAGIGWEPFVGRASTIELARGTYRIVVSGYARGPGGTKAEDYGEVTIQFENPGPEKTVVLPK